MAKLKKSARTYHHGDLRDALMTEALRFVEQRGLAQLSLRELARRLGVSSAAPYHHFANRTALLHELAERGFDQLAAHMREELEHVSADPVERLRALGRGYVWFAVQHPSQFRLMFRQDSLGKALSEVETGQKVRPGSDDSAREAKQPKVSASSVAFQMLQQVVTSCLEQAGYGGIDPMPSILAMWAGVHGIAALRLDGPLATMGNTKFVDALCQQAIDILALALAGRK